jgi:hypothetical protein
MRPAPTENDFFSSRPVVDLGARVRHVRGDHTGEMRLRDKRTWVSAR